MDFLIGGIAGAISRTLTAPLERLKILRQNKLDDGNYMKRKAVRYIFKTEGVRGLFKGNLMNCSRYVPQSAVQFHVFNFCKVPHPISISWIHLQEYKDYILTKFCSERSKKESQINVTFDTKGVSFSPFVGCLNIFCTGFYYQSKRGNDKAK